MRVVIVDLLCNSPFYCVSLTKALGEAGAQAELASPEFYLEPGSIPRSLRSPWIADVTIHASSPRAVRLSSRLLELSYNLRRLAREVRNGEYDVVHVQWVPFQERQSFLMARLRAACDRSGALLAFTAHNIIPHDSPTADRSLIRKNIEMADLVIAHTTAVAEGLRGDVGVKREIAVIPHGPLFSDRVLAPKAQAARRLGMTDGPVVLYQGTILPYKGLDLLADAWPSVLEVHPTAQLAVVGRSGTADLRRLLARMAKMDGVRVVDHYVSTGLMLDYYGACDVVVFPYKAISQSGALMTAVGLGRPAVITPLPGFLEQAAGLDSILVAADLSGRALAHVLGAALDDRTRLAEEALAAKRRIAGSPIGWPSVARRTLEEYSRATALA